MKSPCVICGWRKDCELTPYECGAVDVERRYDRKFNSADTGETGEHQSLCPEKDSGTDK